MGGGLAFIDLKLLVLIRGWKSGVIDLNLLELTLSRKAHF